VQPGNEWENWKWVGKRDTGFGHLRGVALRCAALRCVAQKINQVG